MVFGASQMRFNFHCLSMMWLRTLALELGRTRFKYYSAISNLCDLDELPSFHFLIDKIEIITSSSLISGDN